MEASMGHFGMDRQIDGQGFPPFTWPQAHSHPRGGQVWWTSAPHSGGAALAGRRHAKVMANAVCVGLGKTDRHLSSLRWWLSNLPHPSFPNFSLMSSLRVLATALALTGKCKDLSISLMLSLSSRPSFFPITIIGLSGHSDVPIPYATLYRRRQILLLFSLPSP